MRVGHRCDKKLEKLNTKMNAEGEITSDNAHFKIELKLNFPTF
jgi:hypothetical protein